MFDEVRSAIDDLHTTRRDLFKARLDLVTWDKMHEIEDYCGRFRDATLKIEKVMAKLDAAGVSAGATLAPLEVVERHRRQIELSPGVGEAVQRYSLAVCDDILADLRASLRVEEVTCSLRYPDFVAHLKHVECAREEPHLISQCGRFLRAARAGVSAAPLSEGVAIGVVGQSSQTLNSMHYLEQGVSAAPSGEKEEAMSDQIESAAELHAKYYELLYAVARKYSNESRHETALRYIREAERADSTEAKAASASASPQEDR